MDNVIFKAYREYMLELNPKTDGLKLNDLYHSIEKLVEKQEEQLFSARGELNRKFRFKKRKITFEDVDCLEDSVEFLNELRSQIYDSLLENTVIKKIGRSKRKEEPFVIYFSPENFYGAIEVMEFEVFEQPRFVTTNFSAVVDPEDVLEMARFMAKEYESANALIKTGRMLKYYSSCTLKNIYKGSKSAWKGSKIAGAFLKPYIHKGSKSAWNGAKSAGTFVGNYFSTLFSNLFKKKN